MSAGQIFNWAWMTGWTLLVLPPSIAFLRGWAPAWLRRRATPRMVRARGAGGLLLWVSAVSSASFQLSGAFAGDWYPVRLLAGPGAVLAGITLVVVTDLAERRRRRVPLTGAQ
ncbi:hypothetical protein [Streptomyces sp. NPDC056796]|uniref:hypothetical protein n=1 Tax=Streptomyces sp. NPDC056796 TaxID=3345947 RepID=UPI0036B0B6DB